eukprot:5754575-Amphidinium_carterae.1
MAPAPGMSFELSAQYERVLLRRCIKDRLRGSSPWWGRLASTLQFQQHVLRTQKVGLGVKLQIRYVKHSAYSYNSVGSII